jgi:hypothetical protein
MYVNFKSSRHISVGVMLLHVFMLLNFRSKVAERN